MKNRENTARNPRLDHPPPIALNRDRAARYRDTCKRNGYLCDAA